ncbi:MAG: sigma-54 dependent transcriptional regulator [Alphaproteobacteria bacterium]|nr:sigma-54 dependent transcriptional regulator [Alphaproteobacteria bacterium]
MSEAILIVDDDPLQRKFISSIVSRRLGLPIAEAENGEQALARLDRGGGCLVMIDYRMPGMDGLALLGHIVRRHRDLPVIMLTANADPEVIVQAIKNGASDYITKTSEPERILVSVKNALKMRELESEVVRLRRQKKDTLGFADIIGFEGGLAKIVAAARKVSPTEISVLLTGETGTGKELFARALHSESRRAGMPFIAVNCGAIPESLVESTLFGHEKGAFTGAVAKSPGRFREAHGGTIFLDEVGELPLEGQVKLLRVLQQKEILSVGGSAPVSVDVRIISATNRDLTEMVRLGRFREDLYFRLNVVNLHLPPLRERLTDLTALVHYFTMQHAATTGQPLRQISENFIAALGRYPWPGNVRELENVLQRIFVLSDNATLTPDDFIIEGLDRLSRPSAAVSSVDSEHMLALSDDSGRLRPMQEIVDEVVRHALTCNGDNISAAAKMLGVARSTLYKKMK